jgi:hypothetical protein
MTPNQEQLDRIERRTTIAVVIAVISLVLSVYRIAWGVTSDEIAAADSDRQRFPAPGYIYYASTSAYPEDLRDEATAALRLVVAVSSRQQIAELSIPVQLSPTLHRIDLQQLEWDWREWHRVLAGYPYAVGATVSPVTGKPLPLVVDAGWLIVQLSDTTVSDAHYRLLYGDAKINRDKFLAFWKVNRAARSAFGIVTKSTAPNGPSVAGIRQIENYPTAERGSAWGTRDSAVIDATSDPLEHLEGDFKHDAEEWLVASPKLSSATGQRGFLLAALLADGDGNRVDEAAPSVVTDHLRFRGQAAIRNFGSCIGCHAAGLNPPSNNRVRDLIVAGVTIYAKKGIDAKIEAFHLSDTGTQLKRDNEDVAIGVAIVTGLTCEEAGDAYRLAVDFYDRDVTLEQAAVETGCETETLKLAIAYASNQKTYTLGARLSALAHGEAMRRSSWEGVNFTTAQQAVEAFER